MRSIWKGTIGFGLVSIPMKLYSAVQTSSLDLDMLDGRDHAHIKFQRINENTRKEVPYDKIVKGYKYKEDSYVIVEESDFEAAAPETSYYVEPEAKSNKAYALLLQVLKKSKKAGLARFVLRSSESLCIVHPVENALVVTRIRFQQQIRTQEELNISDKITISKKEMDMGLALVNQYAEDFDVSKYKDEYQEKLLKLIEAKAKGKRPTIKKLKPRKEKEDDLYSQLMGSLGAKKRA
jgi:DNA end-binding protein Ku